MNKSKFANRLKKLLNMEQNKILSLFNTMGAVVLVANETLPDNPLVTMLLDKTTKEPKVDMLGKEIGSIRLEQHSRNLNGGYLNSRKRVAFLSAPYEDLVALINANKLKAGSEVPGKIVIIESLEPMWKNQTPKVNPQTGEAIGVQVGEGFHHVFMQMKFTEDTTAKDKLIRTAEDVNAWYTTRATVEALGAKANTETANIPKAGETVTP